MSPRKRRNELQAKMSSSCAGIVQDVTECIKQSKCIKQHTFQECLSAKDDSGVLDSECVGLVSERTAPSGGQCWRLTRDETSRGSCTKSASERRSIRATACAAIQRLTGCADAMTTRARAMRRTQRGSRAHNRNQKTN